MNEGVRNTGGMVLTGENRSTWREKLVLKSFWPP